MSASKFSIFICSTLTFHAVSRKWPLCQTEDTELLLFRFYCGGITRGRVSHLPDDLRDRRSLERNWRCCVLCLANRSVVVGYFPLHRHRECLVDSFFIDLHGARSEPVEHNLQLGSVRLEIFADDPVGVA